MIMPDKSDIVKITGLFSLTVLIRYFAPTAVFFILLVLFLFFFFNSKKSYLWLAFLFIIDSSPGGLFSMQDEVHTFSFISGAGIGNLYFYIPFIIVALVKVRKVKVTYPKYFLQTILGVLIFYFVFLLAGNGIYKWTAIVRLTLPWLLLYIVPRLLRDEDDYAKFFNLIFAFVTFVLITQVYKLFTAQEFVTLLGGTGNPSLAQWKDILDANAALRPAEGIFIPFVALFGSVYFLTKRKQMYFRPNYLFLITGLSVLSIFITATRAWLLAALFILICYTFIGSKNPVKLITRYAFPAFFVALIIILVPFLSLQADLALQRYETIGFLLQGDITAGGTLSRLSVRAPQVMSHYYQKPIFGWGYGNEGASFSDGHVGHQNLLMHTGLVGYLLFVIFWITFLIKMAAVNKRATSRSAYYKLPTILIIFFLAIHIINTSAQWFNYLTTYGTGFVFSLLFSLGNMLYWGILNEEKMLKMNKKSDR